MQIDIFLFGILAATFSMVASKRLNTLISGFAAQSLFLALITFLLAVKNNNLELYIVAGLLFLIKVILIPYFLRRVASRINVSQDLGLFVNSTLSVFIAGILTYLAYLFTKNIISMSLGGASSVFVVSLSIVLIGLFMMIFRLKALTQIIGLIVMENGLFLTAASISGGMPFFVEIAIFFDVFLCVAILGIFVYKINRLFTHIDIDKLTELKG